MLGLNNVGLRQCYPTCNRLKLITFAAYIRKLNADSALGYNQLKHQYSKRIIQMSGLFEIKSDRKKRLAEPIALIDFILLNPTRL